MVIRIGNAFHRHGIDGALILRPYGNIVAGNTASGGVFPGLCAQYILNGGLMIRKVPVHAADLRPRRG